MSNYSDFLSELLECDKEIEDLIIKRKKGISTNLDKERILQLHSKCQKLSELIIETVSNFRKSLKSNEKSPPPPKKRLKKKSNEEIFTKIKEENDFQKENLLIGDPISSGSFGLIKKGLYFTSSSQEPQQVAIKEINIENEKKYEQIKKEINIQRGLNHPNVLLYIGSWFDEKQGFVVTELCDSDLSQYKSQSLLSKRKRLKILYQIAKGMNYLHSRGVIHRDLKPKNILIDTQKKMIVKICDFGTSKPLDKFSDKRRNTMCGTIEYLAPELVINAENSLPMQSDPKLLDVYSFGIIIWEVWTRKRPFYDLKKIYRNPYPLLKRIHLKSVRPSLDQVKEMPDDLKILMTKCWSVNPNDRPQSFEKIVQMLKVIGKSTNNLKKREGRK